MATRLSPFNPELVVVPSATDLPGHSQAMRELAGWWTSALAQGAKAKLGDLKGGQRHSYLAVIEALAFQGNAKIEATTKDAARYSNGKAAQRYYASRNEQVERERADLKAAARGALAGLETIGLSEAEQAELDALEADLRTAQGR